MSHPGNGIPIGPAGATPHFGAQRPDHSRPDLLSDDELARAIDSLQRKLRSARRMLAIANGARLTFFATTLTIGFGILVLGPAPFLELLEGKREMATTWDVFVWWLLILIVASLIGAAMIQAARRRRRRAAGWKHQVADLDYRLRGALDEQERRPKR